jgi:hypothetical protein
MPGNWLVRFLGEDSSVTGRPYPTSLFKGYSMLEFQRSINPDYLL